ncbi:hypothetical protein CU100_20265 [Phyllobacterium endophyticum]|uniref:Uncharacterized protein n=1 Tax=Phyllobacterium endophyticum TaxID=1149773 RepID=A0A2P7AP59_9HYPH|nr:hypothetical protein CU100_20265 [Phyllobacterium endophyticum]
MFFFSIGGVRFSSIRTVEFVLTPSSFLFLVYFLALGLSLDAHPGTCRSVHIWAAQPEFDRKNAYRQNMAGVAALARCGGYGAQTIFWIVADTRGNAGVPFTLNGRAI